LLSACPDDLRGYVVHVDAAGLFSAAQSFVDELCKETLEVRGASRLVVYSATPLFAKFLNKSAAVREVSERLVVDVRPSLSPTRDRLGRVGDGVLATG
jgi:hypothetical protein